MKNTLLGFVMIAAIMATFPQRSFASVNDQVENIPLKKSLRAEFSKMCDETFEDMSGNIYGDGCTDEDMHFKVAYVAESRLVVFKQQEELSDEFVELYRSGISEIPSLSILADYKTYAIGIDDLAKVFRAMQRKKLDLPRQKNRDDS
jgi:hypothetical protein